MFVGNSSKPIDTFPIISDNFNNLSKAEALRMARSNENLGILAQEPELGGSFYNKPSADNNTRFTGDQVLDGHNHSQSTICETPGCVRAAAKLMDTIDETVDPCDNFYEFACGNYLKNTEIPASKVTVDSFSVVGDLVKDQLKTIINEPPLPNESKPFKLAKNFNQACLNQSIIEERGHKPLADMLEAFGGWPVVKGDAWSGDSFNWIEIMKKFRIFGLSPSIIFSLSVSTDLKNSTKRVLDVGVLRALDFLFINYSFKTEIPIFRLIKRPLNWNVNF